MIKKVLLAILAVVVLIAVAGAMFVYSIFGGNKPVEDGASYGRITVIEDVAYVSMYLIDVGDGTFVLVDGGATDEPEAVRTKLEAHDATPDDLVAVLLTHGHSDHIAAAYALPDVPLYAHELDVGLVEGREAPKSLVGSLVGPAPSGLTVDHTFVGGDMLEWGDVSVEVFHTPGHTSGNSAFLVDGTLLLGDTAQVTTEDQLAAPPTVFSDDPEQAIASIRKLSDEVSDREDKPSRLVGSHSGSTDNFDALPGYDATP